MSVDGVRSAVVGGRAMLGWVGVLVSPDCRWIREQDGLDWRIFFLDCFAFLFDDWFVGFFLRYLSSSNILFDHALAEEGASCLPGSCSLAVADVVDEDTFELEEQCRTHSNAMCP